MEAFSTRVLSWFEQHGRKDLPWQQDLSPYRVWVSEIMLQQTQVQTVIPYYERFMHRFPAVSELAQADVDEVLHHWSGLGYYARGRNLHKAAKMICSEFSGEFPNQFDEVVSLPGIGRSTAGAILSLSMQQRHPILDGNVKRVLCRYHAIASWSGDSHVQKRLWDLAESHLPVENVANYTQAMMDLGATVCTRSKPACEQCPLAEDCEALATDQVSMLPVARPKKEKPTRKTRMLLVRNSNKEVLLHRRPASGIWGGLWSFPEIDVTQNISDWCQDALGMSTVDVNVWAEQRHTFTHFHLDILPTEIILDTDVCMIRENDKAKWTHVDAMPELGLAAPVQKIIRRLRASFTE